MTLDEIKEKARNIEAAKEAHRDAMAQYVEENCPVKVGDTVEVNGYSNTGKKMQVTSRTVKQHYRRTVRGRGYEFFLRGRVFKKDGTLGERYGEHYINCPGQAEAGERL